MVTLLSTYLSVQVPSNLLIVVVVVELEANKYISSNEREGGNIQIEMHVIEGICPSSNSYLLFRLFFLISKDINLHLSFLSFLVTAANRVICASAF